MPLLQQIQIFQKQNAARKIKIECRKCRLIVFLIVKRQIKNRRRKTLEFFGAKDERTTELWDKGVNKKNTYRVAPTRQAANQSSFSKLLLVFFFLVKIIFSIIYVLNYFLTSLIYTRYLRI